MRLGVFVLLAVAAVLPLACGDDDDGGDEAPPATATAPTTDVAATDTPAATATAPTTETSEPTQATPAVATAEETEPPATEVSWDPADYLLSLADLPGDWVEEAPSEEESPLDSCQPEHEGELDRAEFQAASPDDFPQVQQVLVAFETADQAAAALASVNGTLECLVEAFNSGVVDDEEVTFSDASWSEAAPPDLGDGTAARRLTVTISDVEGTASAEAFYDLVYVASGRLAFSLVGVGLVDPIDQGLLNEIAGTAASKLP
jgi:hypothetical protein